MSAHLLCLIRKAYKRAELKTKQFLRFLPHEELKSRLKACGRGVCFVRGIHISGAGNAVMEDNETLEIMRTFARKADCS